MEEMCRAKYGERAQNFRAVSRHVIVLICPCIHQPGSYLKLYSTGIFMKVSLRKHD